jgi:hypothetical protein
MDQSKIMQQKCTELITIFHKIPQIYIIQSNYPGDAVLYSVVRQLHLQVI